MFSSLRQVIEETILREFADGGQRSLSVGLALGEIGSCRSHVGTAQRGLLLANLKLGGIEVRSLRLRLVHGVAIEHALRRKIARCV